jgi:hypothetical protein
VKICIKNISIAFLLLSISSCSVIGWALYKKYTYYKDYSDKEKLQFYADNKTVIDSMVSLSSTKLVEDYVTVARAPNSYGYPRKEFNQIEPGFFDTAGAGKNSFWVNYIQRYPSQETETKAVISGMLDLSGKLKPLFPEQFQLNNTAFLNNLVYIPLKRVKRENEDGGYYYGYLIVFNKAKLDADSIKKLVLNWYDVRQINDNILTNKPERK